MAELRVSYYPDITQHRTPEEIRGSVEVFAAALQEELHRATGQPHTVPVLPVISVRDQTAMAAEERCEIGLMKPSSYIYARRRNPKVNVGAVALRKIDGKIGDTYFAQIYAHVRLGVETFGQLREACRKPLFERPVIGFGDSFSTSNFLVNAALLKDNGIHPLTRFRRIEFFGGHELVAKAVYDGHADVGAGHDGVLVDLARREGFEDAAKVTRRIGRRDIHSDPVALILDDDALRAEIEKALLVIEKLPAVKTALDVFWGAVFGLGPTRHENYKSIEDSIDSLGIAESDVLGE
jgi:ABC-type phosphate/phosphonate transport system substrate-binding protein